MRRVQQLNCAKEVIFVDTTASCEYSGSSLTVMLAATQVGALPIAVLLHQSQTAESYEQAFRVLHESFPLCFGGTEAPSIFMTDDSAAEKRALQAIWPHSKQLLCHFHVAQAEWRYLWGNHGIPKDERPKLMMCFRKVMYANTEEDLLEATEELIATEEQYPQFVRRFRIFFQRKEEWVLLYRSSLLTRNNNTNNFAEATIRILKDVVLNCMKAFNVVALTDFCISIWNAYLEQKLLDFAYNRNKKYRLLYRSLMRTTVPDIAVDKISENCFSVQSMSDPNQYYVVDTAIGCCTCPAGRSGAFCKHQVLLSEKHEICFPNAPPITQNDRFTLGTLALGDKCPPSSFFRDIDANEATQSLETSMENGENSLENVSGEHPCACSSEQVSTDDDRKAFVNELERWGRLCQNSIPQRYLLHLLNSMKKVTTKEGVIRAVRTASLAISSSSRVNGRKIKVQPTSISRRREGITRGHSRVSSGRPAASKRQQVLKRKRCLIENIRKNRPNAKSHGSSH